MRKQNKAAADGMVDSAMREKTRSKEVGGGLRSCPLLDDISAIR